MPILYEELEGSPTITMNREGGSAQRIVKVAWSDIGRAILEIFPGALFGYPYTASLPGFKWLRAQSMDIAPWNPEHPTGTGQVMNTYPAGAKITVSYAPNKYPDADYKDGPDGGDLSDITFLEQKVTFGGEYLTWPNNGVRWEKNEDGTINYEAGGAGDKKFTVFEDINVGVVIPTIEHSLNWNYILVPPWTGIRNCIGKVNSAPFLGAAVETLLFTGCSASRTYSTQGSPTWKLEYRISEKCYNAPLIAGRGLSGPLIVAPGLGYAVGDKVGFVGGVGKQAVAVVTAINVINGAITGIAISAIGSYSTIPARPNAVKTLTGIGAGATLTDPFNAIIPPVAQGWNHFLRPPGGQFERMVRRDGTGVYRSAKFRQLFGGAP